MTPKSRSLPEATAFSDAWRVLEEQGQAPALDGKAAREEAERQAARERGVKVSPYDQRRRSRKVAPRLPADLVARLRALCQDFSGQQRIVSSVLERVIWTVIYLYRAGRLKLQQTTAVVRAPVLSVRGELGAGLPRVEGIPARPRPRLVTISPTFSPNLVAELRRIGHDLGYVDEDGHGVVSSAVLQLILAAAIELYEQDLLYVTEEEFHQTDQRLVWRPRPAPAAGGDEPSPEE